MYKMIPKFLKIAEADLDLDSPETSVRHRELIQGKPILRAIYSDHYRYFAKELESCPRGNTLELGSGGGFIKEFSPSTMTSDVVPLEGVDLVGGFVVVVVDDNPTVVVLVFVRGGNEPPFPSELVFDSDVATSSSPDCSSPSLLVASLSFPLTCGIAATFFFRASKLFSMLNEKIDSLDSKLYSSYLELKSASVT